MCFVMHLVWHLYFVFVQLTVFDVFGCLVFVFSGAAGGSSWGISSIFGGGDNRVSVRENTNSKPHYDPVQSVHLSSTIHLREVYILCLS